MNVELKNNPEYQKLVADAKIDVADYVLSGATSDDFRVLMNNAKPVSEFALGMLHFPDDVNEPSFQNTLDVAIKVISEDSRSFVDSHLADILRSMMGKNALPKNEIVKLVNKRRKEMRSRNLKSKVGKVEQGASASFREKYKLKRMIAHNEGEPLDYTDLGKQCFSYVEKQGAKVIETEDDLILVSGISRYSLYPSTKAQTVSLEELLEELTGDIFMSAQEKKFVRAFVISAKRKAMSQANVSWLKALVGEHTLYLNYGLAGGGILKITPKSVEVLENGNNADDVFLTPPDVNAAFVFDPTVSIVEINQLISDSIIVDLTCDKNVAPLPFWWFTAAFLRDFASTCAHTNMVGGQGSGKTGIAKALSILACGREKQGTATVAALRTVAQTRIIVFLDNIEGKNITQGLEDFLLTAASGAGHEKRSRETDSGIILERYKIPAMVTGIEDLMPDRPEVQERFFSISFDKKYQRPDFIESEYLGGVLANRNKILSAIVKACSRVLYHMEIGNFAKVKLALISGKHTAGHERISEYVSVMYLMYVVFNGLEDKQGVFDTVEAPFAKMLAATNRNIVETQKTANPIVTVLDLYFDSYGTKDAQGIEYPMLMEDPSLPYIRTKFTKLSSVLATLNMVAQRYRIYNFKFNNANQFQKRLMSQRQILEDGGYIVETQYNSNLKVNLYSFVNASAEKAFLDRLKQTSGRDMASRSPKVLHFPEAESLEDDLVLPKDVELGFSL